MCSVTVEDRHSSFHSLHLPSLYRHQDINMILVSGDPLWHEGVLEGALGSVDSVYYGVSGRGKAWYYSCMWSAPWIHVVNGFLW